MKGAKDIVVMVLAAGEGRRFGGIKQLAPIDGTPMIRHVLLNLQCPDVYNLVVVLGAYRYQLIAVIRDLDLEICENEEWERGLSSSIMTGLTFIGEKFPETRAVIIALGDQWKLEASHLLQLIRSSEENPDKIIAVAYGKDPGVPALFPKSTWALLETLQGDQGAKEVLRSRTDVVLVDLPEAALDLDTKED